MNRLVLSIAIYLVVIPFSLQASPGVRTSLDPGWSCKAAVESQGQDLWVQTKYGGAEFFRFRIGSGGSIAEIRDATGANLVAPSEAGGSHLDTDGPIQTGIYATKMTFKGVPFEHGKGCFNKDQGGNVPAVHQPVLSVSIHNTPDGCKVEVITALVDQFFPEFSAGVRSTDILYSVYEFSGFGYVKIRKVHYLHSLFADTAYVNGISQSGWQSFYPGQYLTNEWTSVATTSFNRVALDIADNGHPTEVLKEKFAGFSRDVAKTKGYAYFYSQKSTNLGSVLGVIIGTKPAECIGGPCPVAFNMNGMSWKRGLNISPTLFISNLPVGTMIDKVDYLIPFYGLSSWAPWLGKRTAQLVQAVPPVQIYYPQASLPEELVALRPASARPQSMPITARDCEAPT